MAALNGRDPPPLSGHNKSSFSKEAVVVEARVVPDGARTPKPTAGGPRGQDLTSIETIYGPVVGEVVVLTEVRWGEVAGLTQYNVIHV